MKKQRSFLQSFTWVGVMLLVMGGIFAAVGIITQFAPTAPESFTMVVNGVQAGVQASAAAASLQMARLIYLLTFGLMGLTLMLTGAIIFGCGKMRRLREQRLKQEGDCLAARVVGQERTGARSNYQQIMRLRCAYTDEKGTTYIFKSRMLRSDPEPFLPNGMVNIYYDRNDMSRYFVDVDGSVGLGDKVVEL